MASGEGKASTIGGGAISPFMAMSKVDSEATSLKLRNKRDSHSHPSQMSSSKKATKLATKSPIIAKAEQVVRPFAPKLTLNFKKKESNKVPQDRRSMFNTSVDKQSHTNDNLTQTTKYGFTTLVGQQPSLDIYNRLKEYSPANVKATLSERHHKEISMLQQQLEQERILRRQLEDAVTHLYRGSTPSTQFQPIVKGSHQPIDFNQRRSSHPA